MTYEKQIFRKMRKLEKQVITLKRKLNKYRGGENMMEELIKAVKEGLRVAVLAMIPIAIDGLGKGQVDFKLIGVAGLVAILRFVDSWLHETGVMEKGITRF